MRVLCIISREWIPLDGLPTKDCPKFGEVYSAIGDKEQDGEEYYILAEFGGMYGFIKKYFIPAEETDRAIDQVNEVLLTTH